MKVNRKELKQLSRERMKGRLKPLILSVLILFVTTLALSLIPIVGPIIGAVLSIGFAISIIRMTLNVANNKDIQVNNIFEGFRYILKAIGLSFVIEFFVFLWSLLFIIPGIIAAFRYSQAMYIYAENPEVGIMEAIRKSKKMMVGHKWELFVFQLSFIGWILVGYITCGIGLLWVYPYIMVARAAYYLKLKEDLEGPSIVESDYTTFEDSTNVNQF